MRSARDGDADQYGPEFWKRRDEIAASSAAACVPMLIEAFAPRSVVDIGCGRGHWLAAFASSGVDDVVGVDGSWVAQHSSLLIPPDCFIEHDLPAPIALGRRFDLALCLEVAEHLPSSGAATLVKTLTESASVVVFSAAIPGQGGVGHLNEKWPWYWKEKFAERGFKQFDPFRHRIWHRPDVAIWYKQNMFAYANVVEGSPLHQSLAPFGTSDLTLVACDTLFRLCRPSIARRAANRIRRVLGRE
jgi:SAM-dependent methyltransferase